MRFGAPVFIDTKDPEAYVAEHVRKGYRAAYCPDWIDAENNLELCNSFRSMLAEHDIVLAEVGIWRNVLSRDSEERATAFDYAVRRLQTAEELGARCAVNIVGSWSEDIWDGHHPKHYSDDFFDAAVEGARQVIDAVNPTRTKMTFEVMPGQFLDCASEYIRFLKAVDRKGAGIHLDPANCISSPRMLYDNATVFKNEFSILGDSILSLHLKDIQLKPREFTVQIEEVTIGNGVIDYVNLLRLIDKLPPDTPVMLEHLESEALYDKATVSLHELADDAGVTLT